MFEQSKATQQSFRNATDAVETAAIEVADVVASVKLHIRRNRQSYLIGTGAFLFGYCLRGSKPVKITNETAPVVNINFPSQDLHVP